MSSKCPECSDDKDFCHCPLCPKCGLVLHDGQCLNGCDMKENPKTQIDSVTKAIVESCFIGMGDDMISGDGKPCPNIAENQLLREALKDMRSLAENLLVDSGEWEDEWQDRHEFKLATTALGEIK